MDVDVMCMSCMSRTFCMSVCMKYVDALRWNI